MADEEGVLVGKGNLRVGSEAFSGLIPAILKKSFYKVYAVETKKDLEVGTVQVAVNSVHDKSEDFGATFNFDENIGHSAGLQLALIHLDSLGREVVSVTNGELQGSSRIFFITTKDKIKIT